MQVSKQTFSKYKGLIELLSCYERPLLALSGGLDSSFLAFALKDAGVDASVVTLSSILYPESELIRAKHLSEQLGYPLSLIDIQDRHLDLIRDNPENRCYLCKSSLFSEILSHAESTGCDVVIDGTTYDDGFTYRPGIKALEELGVKSPIREAEISKAEIRELCRYFNLEFADLPSFSCFATRFPYGETLTEEKIDRVSRAESYLKRQGFRNFRVRSHGAIARIEIDLNEVFAVFHPVMMKSISDTFRRLGYDYVTLDLEGFRSGSMDISIKEKQSRIS